MPDLNYLAVIEAAFAHFAVGALWYTRILFGNPWMKSMGIDRESLKKSMTSASISLNMIVSALASFIFAAVIAIFAHWGGFQSPVEIMGIGILLAAGILSIGIIYRNMYEQMGWTAKIIAVGHEIVGFGLAGLIIGLGGES